MWIQVAVITLLGAVACVHGNHDEKKLTKHLLDNYEKVGVAGRPVTNISSAVTVAIRFSLIQLLDINPELQIFDFVGMVYLSWNDSLLTWSSSDHNNLQNLVLPWEKIWTPDIVIQNTIDAGKPFFPANAKVNFQGLVIWVMEYRFKTTCRTRSQQTNPQCQLKFGSWAYNENELSLKIEKDRVDTSYYAIDHRWELQRTKGQKNVQTYTCCPDEPYGDVTYTLTFKRRHRQQDVEDKDKESGAPLPAHHSPLVGATLAVLLTGLMGGGR